MAIKNISPIIMVRTDKDDGDGERDRNCRETFAAGNFWEVAGIEMAFT
jgi:hypothetical protein